MPPPERLSVTGIPTIAVPTKTSNATAIMRRGTRMAIRVTPCSTSRPHRSFSVAAAVYAPPHYCGSGQPETISPTPVGLLHTGRRGGHRQHGLIPLLSHAQLPHSKECQGSAEVTVNHQPNTVRHHPKTAGLLRPVDQRGLPALLVKCAVRVSNPGPAD